MDIKKMINDVVALRGTEVEEYGQPKYMEKATEYDPLIIDTVDVLSKLEEYEMRDFVGWNPEKEEEVLFENLNEYLDYIEENHGIESVSHGNTFNGLAPVSNHIDFEVFEVTDGSMGDKVFVEMKTQLGYGDVRAHYTDSVLLEFESQEQFYEAFLDAGHKEVEFSIGENDFTAHVNINDAEIDVYEYGTMVIDDYSEEPELDSLKSAVAEALDIPFSPEKKNNPSRLDESSLER